MRFRNDGFRYITREVIQRRGQDEEVYFSFINYASLSPFQIEGNLALCTLPSGSHLLGLARLGKDVLP